jgi:hypothetical protein
MSLEDELTTLVLHADGEAQEATLPFPVEPDDLEPGWTMSLSKTGLRNRQSCSAKAIIDCASRWGVATPRRPSWPSREGRARPGRRSVFRAYSSS